MGISPTWKPDMTVSEEEMRMRLRYLDLSDVILKVSLPLAQRGLGWSEERAKKVADTYRGFLFVCWKYPLNEQIPTLDVDQFWHTHIIFTEQYQKDCMNLFGTFLHHRPDFKSNLVSPEWWKTAFDIRYVPKYATFNIASAPKVVDFLTSIIPVGTVVDVGCGTGRISHALAEKGYSVTGVDYSTFMIQESLKGPGTFIQGDMRDFTLPTPVTAALSIFSSFGYFDDKEDDQKVLANVYRNLTSGGLFVLDLRPRLSDDEWRFIRHDDFMGRYRQYSLEEITDNLHNVGFSVKDVYGNYDKSLYTVHSPRMILIAQK